MLRDTTNLHGAELAAAAMLNNIEIVRCSAVSGLARAHGLQPGASDESALCCISRLKLKGLWDEVVKLAAGSRIKLSALVSLNVHNMAMSSRELPGRIKLLNWGDNPSTIGNFRVGLQTLALLEANQRRTGFERVAVDYNHGSVEGSPENEALRAKGQVPPFFAYGRPHVIRDDGLWLEDMKWTPLGVERARTMEDLSPSLHVGDHGEIDFLHSVALTPNGCLQDVTFLSANGGDIRESPREALARLWGHLKK